MGKLIQQVCVEEITPFRQRSDEIQETLESMKLEKLSRKQQHEYKAGNSLIRSFRWKEKDMYPGVLDGAVAFGGATAEKGSTGASARTSKKTHKNIMKAIIKDGFEGELIQSELEKDVVKKSRFRVFDLAKLSDLESKFDSEL
jgi:hypothetical protein